MIAAAEADQWSEDAELIQITSTDAKDSSFWVRGEKGKRKCWNLIFTSSEKGIQYNIYVINGKAGYMNEITMPNYQAINMESDVLIDSDEAEKIAKRNSVEPNPKSDGWATGYHYSLQYMVNNTGSPFLAMLVYGSLDDKFAYIVIDPRTKEVINIMEQQGYDKNGRAIWSEK